MRFIAAFVSLLLTTAPAWASDPSNLVATGRTDTTLYVQWQANGNTLFTLDYLGPLYFGGLQPTCNDFILHENIHVTESEFEVIEGLSPSTWYQIHVHALDADGLVLGNATNFIIVKTRAPGLGFEPLEPGSPDYIVCGGGGDGGGGDDGGGGGGDDGGGGGDGGDDGCAQVTFTLLPGSEPFPTVQVTLVDPSSGNELGTVALPIGEPLSVREGSYHLRVGAPPGYAVTPVQRGLSLSCGDDTAVRLRFRPEPPPSR
ncbi:MAG: fibronectin type III domain-containing protein [Acidobacteria bacterium]|nr:fibronectin type III domain-containing protein [Acidobacteriota bacterium]